MHASIANYMEKCKTHQICRFVLMTLWLHSVYDNNDQLTMVLLLENIQVIVIHTSYLQLKQVALIRYVTVVE